MVSIYSDAGCVRNGYLILKKEGFQEIIILTDNRKRWITILRYPRGLLMCQICLVGEREIVLEKSVE